MAGIVMSGGTDTALWMLGRGTGIVALLTLTLSVCLGIVVRSRRTPGGLPRFGLTALHRTASLTATTLIAVHVLALLLDQQAGLDVVDLIVPFLGSTRPFWLGLGTLALELVLVATVSGLLRKRLGEPAFRALHLTSYLLWPVALAHGLGTGTDAWSLWSSAITLACISAVAGFGWWRLDPEFGKRPVRRAASPAP